MKLEIIPLGTNGYIPTYGRQTMSTLLVAGQTVILLDAGTGVGRLLDPALRERLPSTGRLHVILSHYHLDHTIGLTYLPLVWPAGDITLYCPAPPLTDADGLTALSALFAPAGFSLPIERFPAAVKIVELKSDAVGIDGIEVAFRRLQHPGGSMGIRIADTLVYMTDTVVEWDAVSFARSAALLMHEVWMLPDELQNEPAAHGGHSCAPDVVHFAAMASARELMPIHHHPRRTPSELVEVTEAMKHPGLRVTLPVEGRAYMIGE